MSRYIDADAFIKKYESYGLKNGSTIGRHSGMVDFILDELAKAPTIKPEDLHPKWISVEERLPENEEDVLICVEKRSGGKVVRKMVCTAFYTDGTSNTEDSYYAWSNDYMDMEEEVNRG